MPAHTPTRIAHCTFTHIAKATVKMTGSSGIKISSGMSAITRAACSHCASARPCACVRSCVRAFMRACVRACVDGCVFACFMTLIAKLMRLHMKMTSTKQINDRTENMMPGTSKPGTASWVSGANLTATGQRLQANGYRPSAREGYRRL